MMRAIHQVEAGSSSLSLSRSLWYDAISRPVGREPYTRNLIAVRSPAAINPNSVDSDAPPSSTRQTVKTVPPFRRSLTLNKRRCT
jgi:hypothetical protein